jgi:hypothetical protein
MVGVPIDALDGHSAVGTALPRVFGSPHSAQKKSMT